MLKKLTFVLIFIFLLTINSVSAQESLENAETVTGYMSEDGRFIGDDGFEYIPVGFGFITEEEFQNSSRSCSYPGFQSCAMKSSYQIGESGTACVCRNWNGTTLEAKIRLDTPANRWAQACHLVNGETDINRYVCTSTLAYTGSWTSSHFGYNLIPGYHVAGFRFYARGSRIN